MAGSQRSVLVGDMKTMIEKRKITHALNATRFAKSVTDSARNIPKIIFLLIMVNKNPIHFTVQLKVEFKTLIFITNLTKFNDSK